MISKQWRKAGSANSMQKTEWSFAKNVDPCFKEFTKVTAEGTERFKYKQNQRPLEEWQRKRMTTVANRHMKGCNTANY